MLEFIAQCAVIVVALGAIYVNRDLIANIADHKPVEPDPRGAVWSVHGDIVRFWSRAVVDVELAKLQAEATERNTVLWRILNDHGVAP